jgi:toxin ParE1/3/4
VDYKIIIAPRAISDLRDIVLNISPDRPEAAKRLGYALIEKTKALSAFPRSGTIVREFTDPRIRQLILPPYRIIYRVTMPCIWSVSRAIGTVLVAILH